MALFVRQVGLFLFPFGDSKGCLPLELHGIARIGGFYKLLFRCGDKNIRRTLAYVLNFRNTERRFVVDPLLARFIRV
jgi:hypothetical protein